MTKNSFKYILFFIVMACFTACLEDETDVIDSSTEGAYPEITDIVNGFYDFSDTDNAASGFTVTSYGTAVSSITIMKSFDGGAKVEHETVSGSTAQVSIPLSAALNGLNVAPEDLAIGKEFVFSFKLNTADGRNLEPATTVSVPVSCKSDLAGMYEMTTTYGYHDFLPDFASNTITVEVVKAGEGVYAVNDFSGGLYAADGPYGVNYGTAGMPATFIDICNGITWRDQSDPWGAMIPTDGGVNSVDPATGVITVSWTCLGYGENGVSVYTLNSPALFL